MKWIAVQEAALRVQRAVQRLVQTHRALHREGMTTGAWRSLAAEHTTAYANVLEAYITLETALAKGGNDDLSF